MGKTSKKGDGGQPPSVAALVLAQNLNRLMVCDIHKESLGSNPKLSEKTSLAPSTLSRLRNGKVDATLSTVESLASAFGIAPWQLLAPSFDPKNLPYLMTVSDAHALKRVLEMAREES